jgi:phosphoglycolate phosphatase-like HAD superfamily hydrolase
VLCPDHRQPAFLTKAEAALEIRSRYGLRGEAMLLAGDSRDDAHAAHTCGCAFAAIEYGYGAAATQRDYPVHFVAGRIGQLLELLFPLERDMPSVTGQAVPSSSPL